LGLELLDLKGMGVDLDLTGFNTDELDEYLRRGEGGGGQCDEDAAPEVPEAAVSGAGDVWVMNGHRLLCGDATVAASYQTVLAGKRADLTFTDPPYGVDYEGKTKQKLRLQNDNLGNRFEGFLREACAHMLTVTDGAIYICMASSELDTLQTAFHAAGGHWSTFLIWAKNAFTLGRSDYQRQYEPILYGWAEGRKHYWCGARDQGDVWFFNRPQVNDLGWSGCGRSETRRRDYRPAESVVGGHHNAIAPGRRSHPLRCFLPRLDRSRGHERQRHHQRSDPGDRGDSGGRVPLGERPFLPESRAGAYAAYVALLGKYVDARNTERAEPVKKAIVRCGHRAVWEEMKAQSLLLPDLAGLSAAAPEAAGW
jgi:hypothetical protein